MSVTKQELEGKWNEVKGSVQDRWGQLSDDDLQRVRGNANELVGVIQQRTGESRREIEEFLDNVVTNGASALQTAKEKTREYSDQANEAIQAGYQQATDSINAGYEQAEELVRRRPTESIAVAFGAGIITGVVLGLTLKSR